MYCMTNLQGSLDGLSEALAVAGQRERHLRRDARAPVDGLLKQRQRGEVRVRKVDAAERAAGRSQLCKTKSDRRREKTSVRFSRKKNLT